MDSDIQPVCDLVLNGACSDCSLNEYKQNKK